MSVQAGQTWIDKDKRMRGRQVVIEAVTDAFVCYRNKVAPKLRYRSRRQRFEKAFTLKETE